MFEVCLNCIDESTETGTKRKWTLFSLIGFAVVTAILSCTVRQFNNAAGMNVALAGGAVILLSIIAKVSGVAAALSSVAASGGLEGESVAVIVKAIGIAYTTQIAAALCRDLGETALAVKTELVGRIMLMTLAVPLILKITEMLTELVRNSLTQ